MSSSLLIQVHENIRVRDRRWSLQCEYPKRIGVLLYRERVVARSGRNGSADTYHLTVSLIFARERAFAESLIDQDV